MVSKIVGQCEVRTNRNAKNDERSYRVDFSKYRAMAPHYYPSISIENSILSLVDICEKLASRGFDFSDEKFNRLVALNALRNNGSLDENLRWAH